MTMMMMMISMADGVTKIGEGDSETSLAAWRRRNSMRPLLKSFRAAIPTEPATECHMKLPKHGAGFVRNELHQLNRTLCQGKLIFSCRFTPVGRPFWILSERSVVNV